MTTPIQGGGPVQPPEGPGGPAIAWTKLQGQMKEVNDGLKGLMAPLSEPQIQELGNNLFQGLDKAGKMLDNLPSGKMKDLGQTAMAALMDVTVPGGGKMARLGDAIQQGPEATVRWTGLANASLLKGVESFGSGPVISGGPLAPLEGGAEAMQALMGVLEKPSA